MGFATLLNMGTSFDGSLQAESALDVMCAVDCHGRRILLAQVVCSSRRRHQELSTSCESQLFDTDSAANVSQERRPSHKQVDPERLLAAYSMT
jgi:hypothetical protein